MDVITTQPLWRTDYEKQFTKDMLTDLIKRVISTVKRYGRYAQQSGDTPEDRINSAIAKLWGGTRIWEPERVDLCGFLHGIVTSDLSRQIARAKKASFVSYDVPPSQLEDDYTGEAFDDSGGRVAGATEESPLVCESVDEAWSIAMTHLRERAATDRGVLALLDAYDDGIYLKREVLAHLNWTASTYKRAYARLVMLADGCDPWIRESIFYALKN
jgi:DNA-directed RNA polymerase specialized sigma24 family protein